jgi:hypothetical protein
MPTSTPPTNFLAGPLEVPAGRPARMNESSICDVDGIARKGQE